MSDGDEKSDYNREGRRRAVRIMTAAMSEGAEFGASTAAGEASEDVAAVIAGLASMNVALLLRLEELTGKSPLQILQEYALAWNEGSESP